MTKRDQVSLVRLAEKVVKKKHVRKKKLNEIRASLKLKRDHHEGRLTAGEEHGTEWADERESQMI